MMEIGFHYLKLLVDQWKCEVCQSTDGVLLTVKDVPFLRCTCSLCWRVKVGMDVSIGSAGPAITLTLIDPDIGKKEKKPKSDLESRVRAKVRDRWGDDAAPEPAKPNSNGAGKRSSAEIHSITIDEAAKIPRVGRGKRKRLPIPIPKKRRGIVTPKGRWR